jgi:tetratricopeptide (TPR) repeat protein
MDSTDLLAPWLAAAERYGRAAAQAPGDHRLLGNWGNALWIADQPQRALAPLRQAVLLAPQESRLYRGLGNVLADLQRFEAADRAYARGRQLHDGAQTAWNHSQLLIGLERYAEGYALAERRWQLAAAEAWRDPATAWRGEAVGWHQPLLVWSEQGLGDTIQHLRWLGPLLARRGAAAPPLLLEVEACLVELLRQGLAGLEPQPQVRAKPAEGGAPPWTGWHVSLLSLPALLGGAPLPAAASWLAAPHWPQPLGQRRVGVLWAAGRKLEQPLTTREYVRRSLDQSALAALLEGVLALGWRPVLLQFGPDRRWAEPWRQRQLEELPGDADFAATAELVAGLDLVITVDTAMAHLVGAMGRPGWLLLPFSAAPRWLRERSDTPWYPSLRLFRQRQSGAWGPVVEAVLAALQTDMQSAMQMRQAEESLGAVPVHSPPLWPIRARWRS